MGGTPKTALAPQDRAASLLLFDTVVRYGQQHNPDYEAKNEGPPNAPYGKFSKLRCTQKLSYSNAKGEQAVNLGQ
ncbi:hypothetical protein [Moorena sp. SIO4G3]|uniref:hypothetical protein n=1 Tax=Moorena sp. SIO4G3 TaxID=2607821 RepID=UPI001429CF42|nr:hypothetical protein [Moorena sp. SIO4G3]NEO74990.1 hypothetical protein [Moorena sp. SIO4G3]